MKLAQMGSYPGPVKGFVLLFLFLWAAVFGEGAEYVKYKDPKQQIGVRVKDLMKRMTLEEKIGQMTQIERKLATPDIMKKYFIGIIFEHLVQIHCLDFQYLSLFI